MKNYIAPAIFSVGMFMLLPAPINLIKFGPGYPDEKIYAQLWLCGLLVELVGLLVEKILPPQRK